MRSEIRITGVTITPVAFSEPPLLNTVGVHQPLAVRTIVQVHTDAGIDGLGETYGGATHLQRLQAAAAAVVGQDVFALGEIYQVISALVQRDAAGGDGVAGMIKTADPRDRVFSPFEVACLDVQGKAIGRPVSDLLGGAVRRRVPFSGYLFYKWAGHPGAEEDEWGAALDPDGVVRQAKKMVDEYGFKALKLKGGVFRPEEEVAAILALRESFPEMPLRIDPNAAWTVATSIRVARELDGTLEYLEDPTPGQDGLAKVSEKIDIPLATNMYVVAFDQLKPAVQKNAVQIILSDHHFWGGLRRSKLLGGICESFGMGLSMHSNSHLGISFAAMIHLAAATPNLTYACDTHWPWRHEDVVASPGFAIEGGSVGVPVSAGLGVELDEESLSRLHEKYLSAGRPERDDTAYMRLSQPHFNPDIPKW